MGQKRQKLQLALMLFISAITQFIVMGKAAAVAGAFGVDTDIDAYNAVHSIANFLFSFISSGITTVLIPAYIQNKKQKSIDSFLTLLYLSGIIAVGISYVLQVPILRCFSSGQTGFVEIGCSVFLITMLSQFFNTSMGVSTAYFQVKDKYNIPKVCTLLANAALLILIVADSELTIYRYALYTAITTVANAIVQLLISLKYKYRFSFAVSFKDPEVKEMIKIFLPTVFSAGLYQVNLLTDSFISSRLGEGQISILTYSNQVVTLVNALLITNIITFLYPKIVATFEKEMSYQQERLFGYIYFAEATMALLLVGFCSIGKEAVELLYEHGKFDSANTTLVFQCICLYMIGLPINMARDLIYRFFYGKGNTKETFKNSVTVSILNFVISIILAQFIGLYGVILGTVISSLFSMCMIFARMVKNYGFHYEKKKLIAEHLKIIVVMVASIAIVLLIKSLVNINIIATILIFGCMSVIVFFALLLLVKSQSLKVKF